MCGKIDDDGFTNGTAASPSIEREIPSFINGRSLARDPALSTVFLSPNGFRDKAVGTPLKAKVVVKNSLLISGLATATIGLLGVLGIHFLNVLSIQSISTILFIMFSFLFFAGLALIYHWGSKYEHISYRK